VKLKPIRDQVVVIVGASSGIGRITALEFARRGAKVVVSARDKTGLVSLVDEIRNGGGQVSAYAIDTADYAQVESLASHAAATFGTIDTWVHAAAVSIYATLEQTTPEEFKRILEVNLLGQVWGAKAALPYLRREGRGALIHISSVEARRALPLQSASAASKHGMKGFLDALRVELMHENAPIAVTEIMPASINTPFFDKAKTKMGVKPKGAPPIYQPSLVADAILYAAEHPKARMIVGGAGRALATAEKLSPALADTYLSHFGVESQKTKEPKREGAPNSLFEPVEGFDYVEGAFTDEARGRSYSDWLARHPWAGTALAAVAGALFLTRTSGAAAGSSSEEALSRAR
jgi:NAD(P)-dependent dehydrogenase (short-subunit alcohol dehydrogenase family)